MQPRNRKRRCRRGRDFGDDDDADACLSTPVPPCATTGPVRILCTFQSAVASPGERSVEYRSSRNCAARADFSSRGLIGLSLGSLRKPELNPVIAESRTIVVIRVLHERGGCAAEGRWTVLGFRLVWLIQYEIGKRDQSNVGSQKISQDKVREMRNQRSEQGALGESET
jgi:hypothetical protein